MSAVAEQKREPVHRKVSIAAAVGGGVSVLLWVADTFAGIKISADAAVGLTTALTFVVSYLVPNQDMADE